LDFARPARRLSLPAVLLLGCGLAAILAVGWQYRRLTQQSAALELRVAAADEARTRSVPDAALRERVSGQVTQVAEELATPWTALLSEFEQASADSDGEVALLGIEPDHAKHVVHVTAEARTLARALVYVERLQHSSRLRYTMLDRHEIRDDDPQHPVRFELTSDWRDVP
jgi:hypothetical protein